ncbi:hypothetical protein [Tenacibaculum sp.]|uniref:hypothetical protein n=1 Tax=Tenacibaculum sp. TaxID=1906242 RepID=UPI003D0EFB19
MSCCGQKRTTLKEYYNSKTSNKTQQSAETQKFLTFKYIGKSMLELTGSVSGKTYQFSAKKSLVKIPEYDASSMFGEPLLKKV